MTTVERSPEISANRPISLIQERCHTNHAFYERVAAARDNYRKVDEAIVEPFTGRGFRVPRGHSIRFVLVERPQVGDVGLWSADDPTESLIATRTQMLEGWFIRPHSRLWSDVPHLRPIATCIRDTIGEKYSDLDYHHHWVGSHCAPEWIELRGGGPGRNACRVNLLQAIEPFGLREQHIRDCFMVHQKSRIDTQDGKTYNARSEGEPGDYVELYAEIDLIVGLSICPNADNTLYWSNPEDGAVTPLRVEIYDTGIPPEAFPTWADWRRTWRGRWEPPTSS